MCDWILLGFYDNVVRVDFEHVSNFTSEDLVHHSLVRSAKIFNAEGHHVIVVIVWFGHEGPFFLSPFSTGICLYLEYASIKYSSLNPTSYQLVYLC